MNLGECRACHAEIDAQTELCPHCGSTRAPTAVAPRLVRWLDGVPAMACGSVLLLVLLAGVVRSTRHSTGRVTLVPDAVRQHAAASRTSLERAHQKALASGMSEAEWQAQLAAEHAAQAAAMRARDEAASHAAPRE